MELLERELYLAELDSALDEVCAGAGRIALVSGEAGIGKTSLVERFIRSHRNSKPVLWGVCDLLFTPRPLGPLHDMAAQMGGNMPELLSSDAPRAAIFTAVLSELQRRTAIVVFEDVHWADEATLDLLRFLGRRITNTSALLVMTYRDDELSSQHPLRSVLGDLASSSTTRRILLPPLSEQAVRTLVGERGMDVPALHRQTGGNPFFVTEVLGSPASGIPPTIRDAVLARAARLSLSAHAVLEAAAVIGMRIETWLLAETTGAEAQAAEECIAAGMLQQQGDALSFRHELARQTILETIYPPRRQVLHRLVLDSLKSSPATRGDLVRLAHHAEAAGDREAVLEYAPAAARRAAAASAHREAVALYALALHFSHDLQPAGQAELLQSCALECSFIDQRDRTIEMLYQALNIWHSLGHPLMEGKVLAQLANTLSGLGRDEEAERCSREAIRILEAHPTGDELALAYRAQAVVDMISHNFYDAIAWAEKCITLAEHLKNTSELYVARNIIGSSRMGMDDPEGRLALEKNLAAAHEAGQTGIAAHAYAQLGSISSEMHQFRQAEAYLSEGIKYVAEYDMERLRLYMLAWQALTYLYLGQWKEAADSAEIVQRSASPNTVSQLMALVAMGRLYARQGDSRAKAVLNEALEKSRNTGVLDRIAPVRTARAEAAWLEGSPQHVIEETEAAYILALGKQHAWYVGELVFWRWRAGETVEIPVWTAKPFALQIAGDWRAAAEEWERMDCPYEQARALADGDISAQIKALEIFERLGAQPAANTLRQTLRAAGAPQLPRKPRSSTRENPFGLTHRQVEILGLLMDGLSNAEIAARLHISPKTADHHVSAILAKLGIHSRETAVELARQNPHFHKK